MALFSQSGRNSLVGQPEFVPDRTVTPAGRQQMGASVGFRNNQPADRELDPRRDPASIQQLAPGRRLDRLGSTRTTISMFHGRAEWRPAIATCTTSVRALTEVCRQYDDEVVESVRSGIKFARALKQARPCVFVVTKEVAQRHHAGN